MTDDDARGPAASSDSDRALIERVSQPCGEFMSINDRDRLVALAREALELRERLEMTYVYDSNGNRKAVSPGTIPDGIECRDLTIRGQDEAIDGLNDALAAERAHAARETLELREALAAERAYSDKLWRRVVAERRKHD